MYTHEFALILTVAIPVVAIAGLNLALVFLGERGTLIHPTAGRLEGSTCAALVLGVVAKARATSVAAANDDVAEQAA